MRAKSILMGSALAFGALAAGVAAPGAGGGSAAFAQEQKANPPDRSRRVCRTVTPSGSRLTRRVCRTQAEWDDGQYRTQDGVLQQQMSTTTTYEQNTPR